MVIGFCKFWEFDLNADLFAYLGSVLIFVSIGAREFDWQRRMR